MTKSLIPFSLVFLAAALYAQPDAKTIIARSVAANEADWKAAPQYSHIEQDRTPQGTRTYEVMMILGSPYQRLIKVNGEPLSPRAQRSEQQKLDAVIRERQSESPAARRRRIASYLRDRNRDHLLMQQMAKAFDFTLIGQSTLGSHQVFDLKATPRRGYQPPNTESRVLLGMDGELWIDTQTFQWVKVTAHVIHPVSIVGFLARVEPGTCFELEKMPVASGIWLPAHFGMKADAKILAFFDRRSQEDETYSDYKKITTEVPKIAGQPAPSGSDVATLSR